MDKTKLQQANDVQYRISEIKNRKKNYNQNYNELTEKLDGYSCNMSDANRIMIEVLNTKVLIDKDIFSTFLKNNHIDFDPEIEKLKKEFDEL